MALADRAVYPSQPQPLAAEIDRLLQEARTEAELPEDTKGQLLALIVPDSDLMSGGPVSAAAYRLLDGQTFDSVIIVAPSHEGVFGRLAICRADHYHTPLGTVPVNDGIRNELCDEDDDIYVDDRGHFHTEGADVQIPFLQRILGDGFDVVPIVMGSETSALCRELGHAVGEVMYGHRVLIIASADLLSVKGDGFERFEEALEALDTSALMHLLGSEQVRLEGMGAVITAVLAATRRRANRARVLRVEMPKDDHIGALACALWRA